jgi:hypothetical protein
VQGGGLLDAISFPSCRLLINLYAKVHKYYATGAVRAPLLSAGNTPLLAWTVDGRRRDRTWYCSEGWNAIGEPLLSMHQLFVLCITNFAR